MKFLNLDFFGLFWAYRHQKKVGTLTLFQDLFFSLGVGGAQGGPRGEGDPGGPRGPTGTSGTQETQGDSRDQGALQGPPGSSWVLLGPPGGGSSWLPHNLLSESWSANAWHVAAQRAGKAC